MGGSHRGDILKSNVVHFNTRKHSNECIYYNVDALEDALQRQKKVIFRYYDLNADCEKVYRRDGHHYVVEPVALVFNEDNYYLVAYSSRHDNTANYRVDRMDSVEIIDEDITDKAIQLRGNVGEYTEQAFKMYGDPQEAIVLEFDSKLIGSVYDRFGESTKITDVGGGKCVATLLVQLSPTFWGWLFQFGNQVKILSPETAIKEYKEQITAAFSH